MSDAQIEKIDILKEVYDKRISEESAGNLYEELFNKFHEFKFDMPPTDFLCLSVKERTAIVLHGIPFTVVAKWRYEGWPEVCPVCESRLDAKPGGWAAGTELTIGGKKYTNVIIHWNCMKDL